MEEMTTSSEELAGQADQLLDLVSFFKLEQNHRQSAKKGSALKQKFAASHYDKPGKGQTHTASNGDQTNGNGKATSGFNLVLNDKDPEYEKF